VKADPPAADHGFQRPLMRSRNFPQHVNASRSLPPNTRKTSGGGAAQQITLCVSLLRFGYEKDDRSDI
jgi:hypothetical protein